MPWSCAYLRRGFEAWEICLTTTLALWLLHITLSAWATIQEDGGLLPLVFTTLRSVPPVKAYIKQEKAKISEGIRESRRKAVTATAAAGPEGEVERKVDQDGGNLGGRLIQSKDGPQGSGAESSSAVAAYPDGSASSSSPSSSPPSSKALEPFHALPGDSRSAGDVLDLLRCECSQVRSSVKSVISGQPNFTGPGHMAVPILRPSPPVRTNKHFPHLLNSTPRLRAGLDLHMGEGRSKLSGAIYIASDSHRSMLDQAYSMFSLSNPLHADVWPSVRQMEAEVVAMTAGVHGDSWCG